MAKDGSKRNCISERLTRTRAHTCNSNMFYTLTNTRYISYSDFIISLALFLETTNLLMMWIYIWILTPFLFLFSTYSIHTHLHIHLHIHSHAWNCYLFLVSFTKWVLHMFTEYFPNVKFQFRQRVVCFSVELAYSVHAIAGGNLHISRRTNTLIRWNNAGYIFFLLEFNLICHKRKATKIIV